MTKQEFAIISVGIKSAYPASKILQDEPTMELWFRLLKDLDAKVVENAVMEHISSSKFPPSIAEIRQKCTEYTKPVIEDAGAAWEVVQDAVRKYGFYRAEEAMQSLSPITQKAIRRIGGFTEICSSDNPTVSRAHFFKMYDAIAEREKKESMLPPAIAVRKAQYIEMATRAQEIEDTSIVEKIEEKPEVKRASPEYIDSLMKKYGFKNGSDEIDGG